VFLEKTINAIFFIFGPSNLPVMVAQPDKRQENKPFCVGVVKTVTEHNGSSERRRQDKNSLNEPSF